MKSISSSTALIAGALLVVVGLLGYAVFHTAAPSVNDGFAQCLTEKGVKFYGAWWCPHCTAQKKLFGTAFSKLTSIECSPNNTKSMSVQCKNDGIESFPTWVFSDGTKLAGEQSFNKLAEKTKCELPKQEGV